MSGGKECEREKGMERKDRTGQGFSDVEMTESLGEQKV